MKKILLGTTALVLLSGAAAAQQVTTSSPFTVTLGGSVRSDFAFFDEDASNVNREQRIDTRLTVKAEAKADNGLVYGFDSRIRTDSAGGNGMIMDRKVVYAKGSWGALYLGDHDDARTQQEVLLKTVGIGQSDLAGFVGTGNYYSMFWKGEGNFDTKVTYITPNFAGFTAGVSYTPEVGNSGRGINKSWAGVTPPVISGSTGLNGTLAGLRYADYVEGAAAYAQTFGSVSVKVGAGIGKVLTSRDGDAGNDANWNVGGQVGFAGFTGSAFYYDNNDYGLVEGSDQSTWGLGVAYEQGPWGVGFTYIRSNTDVQGSAADGKDVVWGLGGAYKLAPGLSLQSDLNYVDAKSVDTNGAAAGLGGGNQAWQLVVRTRVDF